ncbi:putative meiosis specific protein Hop1 [Aspergillus nomiae NRRL 13137]|uniref:Putative meiosis specific protein Hop1 n=1 Tax=Aspergillus nomiae NRRL (strain ATCC 15546 / NRRL 13137 / CBS 260.88 / M93) TaxID=1509407 RepID=A0A0L1IXM9_ASPN3|nr:putative meiosis specific protein Hop1 [Aspergillus nomiae NRRL 13137]KNG84254.1 putative meiosis specific protein Hop1 [Aspergillus nomiae NRRL 13137]
MARIKFTVPASAVQVQSARVLHDKQSSTATRKKTQTEVENPTKSAVSEGLSLKQQQSLEMVQIMLHVSFGTLFYLREFLPLPCFDDRDLKEAQRERRYSYREFLDPKPRHETNGGDPDIAFGNGKRGQPLKVMIRGTDPKADMILDVLENGIFDALRKNILEAIQLTILVDKDAPQNVLESYTFSFKYAKGSRNVDHCLESLSIDPVGYVADMRSAQSARVGLETIVRRLITLSTFLPILPNKRNLGVNLFYTEDCPSDYEPPGFTMANNDTIRYPLNENWRKETQSCGTMNSGWHTVGLRVTSLKWTGPDPEGSETLPTVPSQIEYTDEVSRADDIGFAEEPSDLRRIEAGNGVDSDDHLALDRSLTYHDDSSFQETTQDIADRRKLQNMMQTQASSSYSDSDLIPTQPINPDVAIEDEYDSTTQLDSKWFLPEERITKIREHLRLQKQTLDLPRSESQSQGLVRCQCGWNGEETEMLKCVFCGTRQHLLCYGFDGPNDPKIPDVHACYKCLLGPNDTQLLQEMNSLVLLRRALRIILDEGFPNKISEFTQKLHCNGQTIIQITDILKKKGFVQPTPGYKLKGFARRGLPKYSVPQSENVRQRLKREIFHPMVKIKHLYALTSPDGPNNLDPNSISQELDPLDASTIAGNTPFDGLGQKTHNSTGGLQDLPVKRPDHKRKPLPDSDKNESYESDDLDKNDRAAEEQLHNSFLTDESMSSKARVPSQRTSDSQGPRRSGRKRRKISNYSKLIDVGAETSDHESI